MRVITKRTLREFWSLPDYADSEQPLKAWHREAEQATWSDPHEIKAQYHTASILKNNRVVFNIAGNKYRLVVKINYKYRVVYVRFVGTHKQYDAIDVESV
ncbi:MAG: type II toxin-antitoxin system HigB family toxin [Sedimenticola sp.]|nr:type II toxin-antitoxin system HigB family toxin [Sedimenticola sp.]